MIAIAFLAPLLASEAVEFQDSPESFADAAQCRLHLERLVAEARTQGFDAVEGPYEVAPADVRAHLVRAEGLGHRIVEHRCAEARLSRRSWSHSMEDGGEQEEFTVESVARRAPWLRKERDDAGERTRHSH